MLSRTLTVALLLFVLSQCKSEQSQNHVTSHTERNISLQTPAAEDLSKETPSSATVALFLLFHEVVEKIEIVESALNNTKTELLTKIEMSQKEEKAALERSLAEKIDELGSSFNNNGNHLLHQFTVFQENAAVTVSALATFPSHLQQLHDKVNLLESTVHNSNEKVIEILDTFRSFEAAFNEKWEYFDQRLSEINDNALNEQLPILRSNNELLLQCQNNSKNDVQVTPSSEVLQMCPIIYNLEDMLFPTEVTQNCKAGWTQFDGSCYLFSTVTGSWFDGSEYCRALGGDYVKVTTDAEFQFIKRYADTDMWIGMNDRESEGIYRWASDNTTYCFNEAWWHNGEPNNEYDEDCVHYWVMYGNRLWNDEDCTFQKRYVCETTPN